MKIIKYFLIAAAAALLLAACSSDFLDTEYKDGIDDKTVGTLLEETPDAVVDAYARAMYSYMVSSAAYETSAERHDIFTFTAMLHAADMMAQDMVQAKSDWFNYDYDWYAQIRQDIAFRPRASWSTLYTMIAKANAIINLFTEEPTNPIAKAAYGQALAVRGLSYYYLIQLFQKSGTDDPEVPSLPGVPLRFAASENVENAEALTGRNTIGRIREQIVADLTAAIPMLESYERPYKYFIDQNVAKGFLARYYLLIGEWELAASTAADAHKTYNIMAPASLHDGFMDITNEEWMWGFDHSSETQTTYASFFSMVSNKAPGYAGMNYAPRLIDAGLFAQITTTDERRKLFNDEKGIPNADGEFARAQDLPYANLKFGDKGDWTMDYVYMRAAEMVLIEAEALAQQGKNTEAATALKKLMSKRDVRWSKTSVTVDEVFLQRRIELWGEGFGFFDLKRLGKGVNRKYEGSNHRTQVVVPADDARWVYQLPQREMQENALITENNP